MLGGCDDVAYPSGCIGTSDQVIIDENILVSLTCGMAFQSKRSARSVYLFIWRTFVEFSY